VGSWRRPGAGELVIRHKGREVSLALHCDEPSETMFAAFYADCLHEVRPVTSGCRLTLVYNLFAQGEGARLRSTTCWPPKAMQARSTCGNGDFRPIPACRRSPAASRGRALAFSHLAASGFQGYSPMVRSLRLAVRTSPSHGENRSSILLGSASSFNNLAH
jgi:hypothetical protein